MFWLVFSAPPPPLANRHSTSALMPPPTPAHCRRGQVVAPFCVVEEEGDSQGAHNSEIGSLAAVVWMGGWEGGGLPYRLSKYANWYFRVHAVL